MADTETIEKHYYTEGSRDNSALWAALMSKGNESNNATENISKCDVLISDLDDAYREKKTNEERLDRLEKMIEGLIKSLGN